MRVRGYVSPAQAAERLGINQKTAFAWAKKSLNDEGPLHGVRQTPTRRLLIPLTEVTRLLENDR